MGDRKLEAMSLSMRSIAVAVLFGSLAVSLSTPTAGQGPAKGNTAASLQLKKEQNEFLKAVLQSMNVQYTVTASPDGVESIEYYPADIAQATEISSRASQYLFIKQECPRMALPLPSQPARASLSCTRSKP